MEWTPEMSCIFKFKYGDLCCDADKLQQSVGDDRIKTIIQYSKCHEDGLYRKLENGLATAHLENRQYKIACHRNCISKYVSPRNKKSMDAANFDGPPAKVLRKSYPPFEYKLNCLYCGQVCCLEKDEKHKDRWIEAYPCRSIYTEDRKNTYKQYLLEKCKDRGDEDAEAVRMRVENISDLVAVEARYHKDCLSRFISMRSVLPHSKNINATLEQEVENAFEKLCNVLEEDKTQIWNSIELFQLYQSFGGLLKTKGWLVSKVKERFPNDILVLYSNGYASIIAFKQVAATKLKLVKDNDPNEEVEDCIKKIVKQIKEDCAGIPCDIANYEARIDLGTATISTSDTLAALLARISPALCKTLPAVLIGNMVTSAVRNHTTPLQVSLGILLKNQKTLINHFHDYRVTCTHDEVLRFKKSVAVAKSMDIKQQGISGSNNGLLQVIGDNYDTTISSQNGKLSTHSIGMIVIQPKSPNDEDSYDKIRRLKKEEMSIVVVEEEPLIDNYCTNLEKKPKMPAILQTTLPPEFFAIQQNTNERANDIIFDFFNDILLEDNCPEFNGYGTRLSREQGHSPSPKTKVVYLPLIDKPPADPSTIYQSLLKAQQITGSTGQEYVVYTADQQLYRVALNVVWSYEEQFSNIILRLGGMHLLMSYVGSVGSLMAETGLSDILGVAFGSVEAMLSGKRFPQNVRALRMVVEELLRPIVSGHSIQDANDLMEILNGLCKKSRTCKLWVTCLIIPVFHMNKYILAERDSDWPLHLLCLNDMLPLFFAAGHFNYARYALYYARSMENMPAVILDRFMKGEHTMHHNEGIHNGIWSDMAIETTYMRYGHSTGGITGITLKEETLKVWAYSRHACCEIVNNLNVMRDEEPTTITHHKEEGQGRIKGDASDRKALREKLSITIDPLDPQTHPKGLVNVVTGEVINLEKVNVDDALQIGRSQMVKFESNLPEGFHETISKSVHTLATARKYVLVGETKVFDMGIIYARAMTLRSAGHEIDEKLLMSHELAPYPTSIFTQKGQMREATTKSKLKNILQIEASDQIHHSFGATFIDGCAALWVVPWPVNGTVQDFLNLFRRHVHAHLSMCDVYLIFDRYFQGSPKDSTRVSRAQGASRVYKLSTSTPLPPQKVALTVTANKIQLIDLICEDLIGCKDEFTGNSLILTGKSPIPIHLTKGLVIPRHDMVTHQEEADTIIIQQLAAADSSCSLVIANDTDIFVLLMHYIHQGKIGGEVFMKSPGKGQQILDIHKSVEENMDILSDLLPVHIISGCDTVGPYFGIGKHTALRVLRSGKYPLDKLGDLNEPFPEVLTQAQAFILACYGKPHCLSMTAARYESWSQKVGRSTVKHPNISSLPPTDEGFSQNILRAHIAVAVCLNALNDNVLDIDYTDYGFYIDDATSLLLPCGLPANTPLAPEQVLRQMRCACKATSTSPCTNKKCTCFSAGMTCNPWCGCGGGEDCQSHFTKSVNQDNEDEQS